MKLRWSFASASVTTSPGFGAGDDGLPGSGARQGAGDDSRHWTQQRRGHRYSESPSHRDHPIDYLDRRYVNCYRDRSHHRPLVPPQGDNHAPGNPAPDPSGHRRPSSSRSEPQDDRPRAGSDVRHRPQYPTTLSRQGRSRTDARLPPMRPAASIGSGAGDQGRLLAEATPPLLGSRPDPRSTPSAVARSRHTLPEVTPARVSRRQIEWPRAPSPRPRSSPARWTGTGRTLDRVR